jgi:hypothetical protein
VLIVAGGAASGAAGTARRRVRPGTGRRGQPDPGTDQLGGVLTRGDAVAGRAVQGVFRGGRRLWPRRGLRRGGAGPAGRGVGRPGLGGAARQCAGAGWRLGRADGAERPGAGFGDPRGAGGCRGGGRPCRVCRGARNRHLAGRSDRGGGTERGVRCGASGAAAGGIGEGQSGAHRGRGWAGRPGQGGAGAASRDGAAASVRGAADAACGLDGQRAGAARGAETAGGGRPGGGEFVRVFRHQCARRAGGCARRVGAGGFRARDPRPRGRRPKCGSASRRAGGASGGVRAVGT